MSLTLYRRCLLGESLTSALNELKNSSKITENLETKTLEAFDKLMCDEISKRYKNKCNIKGKVTSFKNCDDIWIFYGKDVTLKSDQNLFSAKNLKVVACDVNMKNNMNRDNHYQEMLPTNDDGN